MTQSSRVHHNPYLTIEVQLEWGLSYQELLFIRKLSSYTRLNQRAACLPQRTVPLATPPGCSPQPSLRSRWLVLHAVHLFTCSHQHRELVPVLRSLPSAITGGRHCPGGERLRPKGRGNQKRHPLTSPFRSTLWPHPKQLPEQSFRTQ